MWEAYSLLRIAFPETSVAQRSDIMSAFFRQGRSDRACLVFGHMRQAEEFVHRPKPSTYVRCFRGIAAAHDVKNLELVHNMLRLDVHVNLSTQLLNSVMLAYALCGDGRNSSSSETSSESSMQIFREILQSEEGPSLQTIEIFFKMCESHPTGADEAAKMMRKMRLLGIECNRRLYTAYIEALAAQSEFYLATAAVDEMYDRVGCKPTAHTYVSLALHPLLRILLLLHPAY